MSEDEDFIFDLDGGEAENPSDLYSSPTVNKDGMYHVECVKVSMDHRGDPDSTAGLVPEVKMQLMVLQGDHEDQISKLLYYSLKLATRDKESKEEKWNDKPVVPLDEKQLKNLRLVAYSFGLISSEDVGKPKIRINWKRLEGAQAVVRVSHVKPKPFTRPDGTTDESKERWSIEWPTDFYNLRDEKVKDVKKDGASISMLGGSLSGGGGDLLDGIDL